MVKRLLSCLTVVLLATGSLFAQTGIVSGSIVDSDNRPLIGANVIVKGTTIGTITNVDGQFELKNVPVGNQTITASFIGYLSEDLAASIESGKTITLNFKLIEDVTNLEELIVIGYGTVKKSDATGSVVAVKSDDFNKGPVATPDQLITGKVAGVQITSGGGAPGSGQTIRIRGGASINASNDPLIVIDGVPLDNAGISGLANPLSTINPNDIESMTVLKDASATAIYGSRASNGVIIITTKKGKEGAKLKVEYNGNFSYYTLPNKVDVLNGDEFRIAAQKYAEEVYPSSPSTVTSLLGTENTDWQDEVFQNAMGTDHNVGVSGAYDFLPYRFSVGYFGQEGNLKTGTLNRVSGNLSLNPSFFDDHLKVNLNAKGTYNHTRFANEGAIGAAVQMDPTKPVYVGDSLFYWSKAGQGTNNPVALLEYTDDQSDVNRLIGNVQLDYKFHFLPDLRANLNLGYDGSNSEGYRIESEDASWTYNPTTGNGTHREYTQEKTNKLLDFYLQYAKDIESANSYVDAQAGYSYQNFYRSDWSYTQAITDGTNHGYPDTLVYPKDWPSEYTLISFFGRVNYRFMDRYLLTLTLRNDNSSRFSKDTRSGMFPAVALGWNLKEEGFAQNWANVSQLKLRGGWGITGQQAITSDDYPYQAKYLLSRPNATYQFGDTYYQAYRPDEYDANIKWEETSTTNIGFDYGFYNDRINGSFELYYKKSKDLINTVPVPAGANFSNYVLTNVGDMENRGLEFNIVGRPISTKDMFWEIGFNCTYNKNEITKLTSYDDPNYLGIYTGGISGGVGSTIQIHSVGYPANSYFVYQQVYDESGKPIQGLYADRNEDGQITEEDKYRLHDPNADFYFGLSTKFEYKQWTFSLAGRAQFGNYVYNNVSSNNGELSRIYRSEGNYLSNITRDALDVNFTEPQYLSDYYIKNASFFRMDNMTLSYRFKNIMEDKINLSLSATVNNAFVITKYEGLDPEVVNGIDNNIYPRPRVFMMGVSLTF